MPATTKGEHDANNRLHVLCIAQGIGIAYPKLPIAI